MAKKQTRRTKIEPRTAAERATPRPVNLPLLTDPHLVALLSFLNGDSGPEDDRTYALANQVASAMLTSLPLTDAFDGHIDRPDLYDQICQLMTEESKHWADPAEHGAIIRQASYTLGDQTGDHDTVQARRASLQWVAHMLAERSVFVGACLMYHMLKGGVR
jgi:hypothetical protein